MLLTCWAETAGPMYQHRSSLCRAVTAGLPPSCTLEPLLNPLRCCTRGKTIMLDCGIHPGFANEASLPYLDDIDLDEVDVMLVTHFHLDHSAAVPFVVGRTPFKVEPSCLPFPPTRHAWLARVLQCARLQMSQYGAGHRRPAAALGCCWYFEMRLFACKVRMLHGLHAGTPR